MTAKKQLCCVGRARCDDIRTRSNLRYICKACQGISLPRWALIFSGRLLEMPDEREIVITARVSRKLWFQFRDLMTAHRVPVYRGVEQALMAALERAGIEYMAPDEMDDRGPYCES